MDIILNILFVILVLLLVGALIWLFYKIIMVIYYKALRYETFPSTAEVCKKEYKDEHSTTTMILVGKVLVPRTVHYDAQYNVYLMYNSEKYCLDDEILYNSVNVGDIVRILVHNGYNKRNELKHVYLSVEE